MVGTSAHNSDIDPVSLVPSCIAVDDVDSVSSVQVVDCSLPVDLPDLGHHMLAKVPKQHGTNPLSSPILPGS